MDGQWPPTGRDEIFRDIVFYVTAKHCIIIIKITQHTES